MFQQKSLPNESPRDDTKQENNGNDAAVGVMSSNNNKYMVDGVEKSRVIKAEEYSACVALLDMAKSPEPTFAHEQTHAIFDTTSQNMQDIRTNTGRGVSQDFPEFFPQGLQFNQVEIRPEDQLLGSEVVIKSLEAEESYRSVILDHNYHKKVEEEITSEEHKPCTSNEAGEIENTTAPSNLIIANLEVSTNSQYGMSSGTWNNSGYAPVYNHFQPNSFIYSSQYNHGGSYQNVNYGNFQVGPQQNIYQFNGGAGPMNEPYLKDVTNTYFQPMNYTPLSNNNFINMVPVNGVKSYGLPTTSYLDPFAIGNAKQNFENDPMISMTGKKTNRHYEKRDVRNYEANGKENISDETIKELNKKYLHQRFPTKLWNLASDESFTHIRWSEDGTSLVIDEGSLEPCLGHFFRSKKFASFLRQMHLYGFRKVNRATVSRPIQKSGTGTKQHSPREVAAYHCQYFHRDHIELLKEVKRFYPHNEGSLYERVSTSSSTSRSNSPASPMMPPMYVNTLASSTPLCSSAMASANSSVIYHHSIGPSADFVGGKGEQTYHQQYYLPPCEQMKTIGEEEASHSSYETMESAYGSSTLSGSLVMADAGSYSIGNDVPSNDGQTAQSLLEQYI